VLGVLLELWESRETIRRDQGARSRLERKAGFAKSPLQQSNLRFEGADGNGDSFRPLLRVRLDWLF